MGESQRVLTLLVDERRLAAGLDTALVALVAQGPVRLLTPATFLERLTGLRVIGDAERRAVVRRIAATRDDIGLPRHVRASASFATRVIAALDGNGERAPFERIAEHYTTLLAFANVLDVPSALQRATAGERRPLEIDGGTLAIDPVLQHGETDGAFAWRRLAAVAGLTLVPAELGPLGAPVIDAALRAGVERILTYAETQSDADARRAIRTRISGVAPDDASALITASAGHGTLIDLIESGKFAFGPGARDAGLAFVRGLRAVSRAYAAPDASAQRVLAAIGGAFPLDHEPTVAALARIAQDFDRARTLGPLWDADALIAEFDAELGVALPLERAPAVATVAQPRGAETRRPVPLRRTHFSASSLNAYAECARKWYFRYVCAAVEDRGSSASFYGTAFHAALEEFHLEFARIDGADPAILSSALDRTIVSAFERYRGSFDAPVEFELQRRRARRTAKKYVEWLVRRARAAPFTVAGCEVATDLELDGHAFVGYIDRVDRDDRTGDVTVIDYKTGAIATSAAEYRDDVAAFREFQLPFYYWARTAAGDRVTRLALIPLKDALLDVAPIELEIVPVASPARGRRGASATVGTIGIDELQRARAKMIDYATLLSSATLDAYPATDDPDACRYCAYLDACRERPLVSEERFGR